MIDNNEFKDLGNFWDDDSSSWGTEDLNDLQSWFEGNYAYWNVGAIAEDYSEEEILSAINLFATENLSEEEEEEAA